MICFCDYSTQVTLSLSLSSFLSVTLSSINIACPCSILPSFNSSSNLFFGLIVNIHAKVASYFLKDQEDQAKNVLTGFLGFLPENDRKTPLCLQMMTKCIVYASISLAQS